MALVPGMAHAMEETATAETLASRYGNPGVEALATPVVVVGGMRVRTTVRLKTVDGLRLVFEAGVHDKRERMAEGEHERFIIAMPKFLDRVAAKSAGR